MSHLLKFFLGFILASTHCLASVSAQPNPTLSRDDNGFVTLQWLSLPGHTYFMQCSFDLVTWTYFGEVIHSGFGIEKITFDPTDDHIFFRIVGSDIPTYDAVNDDFNGDGISNGDSIDQGIDPLTPPPGTIPPGQIEGLVPGHAYTLEVVQINGANAGTRAYLLDRDYRLLENPTAPIDTFPIPITSTPAAAQTTITFTSVNPAQHDTPIDLILYTSIPEPGNSSNLIRGLEKIPPLIIPKGQSSITSTRTFTGTDIDVPTWYVAPFVVRGIDQAQALDAIGIIGSWDSGVDETSRRAAATDLGVKTDT